MKHKLKVMKYKVDGQSMTAHEVNIFKQKGSEKDVIMHREEAAKWAAHRHEENVNFFNTVKKIYLIINFPHGLLYLHLKRVRKLKGEIQKHQDEIKRLKLVMERKLYYQNQYKGGKIDWDDNLLEED